jgi:putative protease
MKPELLAPAGNMESLHSAIMAGCDAVYLGGKKYGARAYSSNFSDEEMVEAIHYAHMYGVKVYVTCNTIIFEDEVNDFLDYIDFLHKNNVDAVLIQDLGMLDLVRKTFPNLDIHASTQMHIHNLDGVELMAKLGLKRVVLARETSIKTIKEIKSKTKMPIEVFIHGALCISYSGECLMSYFNGGRSGNRGECAGCCRLPYDVLDDNKVLNQDEKYPLSAKDLNTLENIGDLIDIGVDSLKIEGRMKSASYVFLVVSLYRQAIDSYIKDKIVKIDKNKLHDLMIIFNRMYTKGFLFNEFNNDIVNMKHSNHQGIKIGQVIGYSNHFATIKLNDDLFIGDGLRIVGHDELGVKVNEFYCNHNLIKEAHANDLISIEVHIPVYSNDIVLKTSSEHIDNDIKVLMQNSIRKVDINGRITLKVNKPLILEITDGVNTSLVTGPVLDRAKNIPTTLEIISEKMNKIGETCYRFVNLDIELDKDVFVPLKVFNDLRREAIDKLTSLRIGKSNYIKDSYKIDIPDFKLTRIKTCLVGSENLYNKLNHDDYDIIYANEIIPNTIYRLPRVNQEYHYDKNVLITDIGALNCLKNVDSDATLNITNSYGVAFLHSLGVNKVTLSYELSYEQVRLLIRSYKERYLKEPNVEVVTHGLIEIMINKFNLGNYYNNYNLKLRDHFNNIYPISFTDNYMVVYSSKPINLNDDYYAIGAGSIRTNIF